MSILPFTVIAVSVCILLAGCMSDDVLRTDGVTIGAGEAIAANSVMQMVDPWPAGVEDTDLATPSDIGQYRRAQQAASGARTETATSVGADTP